MLLARRQCAREPVAGLFSIREPGERVEIGELHDPMLGAPFARQRYRHLPNFMRMKGLLQIGKLLLRRNDRSHLSRVHIRIRRAQHDLDGGVQLADARRGPHAVGTRRHPHVEEGHCKGVICGDRVAHRGDRRFRALAGLFTGANAVFGKATVHHLSPRRGFREQPVAEIPGHCGLAVHVGLGQDIPIRVAHLRFVVGDEHAYRSFDLSSHGSVLKYPVPPGGASNAADAPSPEALTRRPDPAAERRDRIRAPVQPDSVIRIAGLR